MEKIRWGILGTGNIARVFATGLGTIPDAELVAVGSRTAEKAEAFGQQFKVPHRHDSYEALARDPDVDVVYVATPHVCHHAHARLCLEAGKHVLCEKPFTINARECADLLSVAQRQRRFLMEAMWTRFLPVIVKVRELLAQQAIGEVRMVTADIGFRAGRNPEWRLFNPALGGGALLDLGVYAVALAYLVYGRPPTRVTSAAEIGPTGVDEQAGMIFQYDRGELALLTCAIRTSTPQEATIMGTEGQIRINPAFWHPTSMTLRAGRETHEIKCELVGNGYHHEAVEVMQCLRSGKLQSDVIPLAESLHIMQTMDELRAQWGVRYPTEK